ncbi:alanine racemase [Catenovulum sp. 2E275]|uniref:alanine racemase n=1 Tax=Catenovulum sp. 2E275 TaxID=2980497 RepID=UPI0021D2E2D0|nr:alanine racemase [Catenovulum sp. 2E275]MCU4677443.1 alanine racemase [Catenovulum sp. 2E275]
MKTAIAQVNLSALQHNLSQVKQLAPDSNVLAVCKANGYGHGLVEVAQALEQADAYGVARIEEAFQLRTAGITKTIVLLEGFFQAKDIASIAVNQFQTIVHCEQQLIELEQASLHLSTHSQIKVWLKIDTGMSRLGVNPAQVDEFVARLQACPLVHSELTFITHLACADELNNDYNQLQLSLFEQACQAYPFAQSIANSAATMVLENTRRTWVRPGIMLYGVSPIEGEAGIERNLKPVMTLSSSLISVKAISAGTKVGYGSTWQADKPTKLGVVAIGYGDGYPRHAKNGTPVLVNGRIVPLVGRVSMDMIMVDLGIDSIEQVGDTAILWGEGLPIERVADSAGTIPYEILCQLTSRVRWQYV